MSLESGVGFQFLLPRGPRGKIFSHQFLRFPKENTHIQYNILIALMLFSLFFLVVVISSEDEDPGAEGGDEYEEDQESDSDIDEEDLWSCPQCNLKNHPMSRQCARCWVERHEWLPHLKRCVNIV